jgi:hypothetical protein
MSANAFDHLSETGSTPAFDDTTEADALALVGIPRRDDDTAFDHIHRGLPTSVVDRLAEALAIAQRELLFEFKVVELAPRAPPPPSRRGDIPASEQMMTLILFRSILLRG